jgi:acetyltransferase
LSLGDGGDVSFADTLTFLANDPNTNAILLYIESVNEGRAFMSAARNAARTKPVICIKAGSETTTCVSEIKRSQIAMTSARQK